MRRRRRRKRRKGEEYEDEEEEEGTLFLQNTCLRKKTAIFTKK